MLNFLRLAAALLGLLALPAAAQTPNPAAPRGAAPPMAPVAPRPAVAPAPLSAVAKRVDINSATAAQLDALPGVGPARSAAIVAGRPYDDASQLVTKKVLPQNVFDGIKDRIALANINTSSAAEMQRTLKGVGDVRAKAIVAGRPYSSPQDLVAKKVLPQGVYDGMKDQISY